MICTKGRPPARCALDDPFRVCPNRTSAWPSGDAVIDALGKRFTLLERQLEGKTYLTGERFTIVDAYAYVVLNWTNYHKIDVDPWPGLKTFLQRVKERPAVQQARREEGLPV
jgi:glutathione S-transferase